MYKNEDPLDSLFRKTADHLKVDFEERDWNRMSRMLDDADHRRLMRIRVFGTSAIIVMAGLSFVFIEKLLSPQESNLTLQSTTPAKTIESKTQKNEKQTERTVVKKEFDGGELGAVTRGVRTKTVSTKMMAAKTLLAEDSGENVFSSTARQQQPHLLPRDSSEQTNTALLKEPSIEKKDSLAHEALIVETERIDDGNEKRPRAEKLPWSAALVFAPDFSSINMKEYTSPGQTAGVVAYCPLSRKFAVGAGLMQSKKVYTGSGADYHVPTGYWDRYTSGVVPENINGSCTIVEMSLQMRYQITLHRSNVHAMAGVSSYYMFNESYQYSFTTQPYGPSGFNSEKNSMYLFKIASVSVGYERYLSSNLLVGIEPYVKLPMVEMGWSNVRLFSAGMFMTLRYSFKKSERHVSDSNESPEKKL